MPWYFSKLSLKAPELNSTYDLCRGDILLSGEECHRSSLVWWNKLKQSLFLFYILFYS